MLRKFPRTHLVAVIGVALIIASGFIFTPARNAEAKKTTITLSPPPISGTIPIPDQTVAMNTSAPEPEITQVIDATQSQPLTDTHSTTAPEVDIPLPETESWNAVKVKNGDTLTHVFAKAGYPAKYMYKVLGDGKPNKTLTKIYPGETVAFLDNGDGAPKKIKLTRNKLESFEVYLDESGKYQSREITVTPDVRTAYAEGNISSSLFLAAKSAGLSEALTMELASIFGWDIDFVLDIRSGDQFSLVFEELMLDGEKIGNGKILAASFTNKDKIYKAVLYKNQSGRESYYAPDGSSMKGEFLRSPIEFARISSHFNLKRKHPVLHKIRAHKGTDYAAGRGTPIRATGDGKVILAGRKGGYGKTVIIQHGHKYTTLYAHMHKYGKGVRSGKRVKQGQIIGYVGSTGLATGPHLHYEFRVNGRHKNPVTVSLPKAQSIPRDQIREFRSQTSKYLSKLDTLSSGAQLAMNP